MRNELVAVAPALPSNGCAHCSATGEDSVSLHICRECGMPQPIQPGEDYFSAFGVPRRFAQNRSELEQRFYLLSRALHPDRFTTAAQKAKDLSLQRMSLVNQAYQTLRDPSLLAQYLLELEKIKNPKTVIPMEIAESWFEVQELILDEPGTAAQRLQEFESKLEILIQESESGVRGLENRYDAHPLTETLEEISQELQKLNYLRSLNRDVERIKKNANSN